VPLSDREQKILEEIERNLYEEDPRLARDASRSPRLDNSSRFKLGLLLFVLGLAILVGFFASGLVVVGVIAFGSMVAGIVLLAGSAKDVAASSRPSREQVSQRFSQWEQRLREKYKKR
jgi:Protein of unknown function (DUF3040)